MPEPTLGFIGGSGLYDMDGLANRREVEVETPFGSPSDSIVTGDLDGVAVAFLPRHGRGHRISPSELPGEGQHLRAEAAGRTAGDLYQRGGEP